MKTYTIKELSELFQLPASTLRYYESLGILTNVGRTEANQRIYYEMHVNRLRSICCFKRAGMSMAELQELFRYEEDEPAHMDEILELLQKRQTEATEQLKKMETDLEHLNRKLAYYSAKKKAMSEGTELPNWGDYKK